MTDLGNKLEDKADVLDSIENEKSNRKEQLKEINNFLEIFDESNEGENETLSKIPQSFPKFFRFPKSISLRLDYGNEGYKTKNFETGSDSDEISRYTTILGKRLRIKVYYNGGKIFTEYETLLFKRITKIIKLYLENTRLKEKKRLLTTFYREILNAIKNGVWVSDEKEIITYCNSAMQTIAGVPVEQIIGKNVLTDFHHETVKIFKNYYIKARNSLKPVKYKNIPVDTPSGRKSIQSGWLIPRIKDGKYNGMICTIDDLTEKYQIKEQLDEKKSLYEAIVFSNSIGVAVVDMKGHPLEINDYLLEMFGYSAEELRKMHFKEFTFPKDKGKDLGLYKELIAGKRDFYHIEKRYIHKDGSIVWGYLTATLIRDSQGQPNYVISLVQDITEKKHTEQKLRKSKENLKELNQKLELKVKERTQELSQSRKKYKQAFKRVNFYKNLITHDMSNILQNIYSSVELVLLYRENPSYSDELNDIINVLKEQTIRGINFIKNARNLANLENKQQKLQKIDLLDEIEDTVRIFETSFLSRELDIKIKSEINQVFIKANELINDVIENLLSNSIKYNDSKKVEIRIKISTQIKEDTHYVRVEVIDNGIGIPDNRKKEIFNQIRNKKYSRSGMGLGLSLVKTIVHIFDGKIWVENRIKNDYTMGSKFILLLPEY
ncbi:MAG: putative Histidine kinase [Promethearchaeota archaeon]|nr:MAG: putative Histidine kinase [Candidatus Lokiarchaeota archaeon]